MAERRAQPGAEPRRAWWRGPIVRWGIAVALVAFAAAPPAAQARPSGDQQSDSSSSSSIPGPPSAGSRPAATGTVQLPKGGATIPPPANAPTSTAQTVANDPYLQRIAQEEAAVEKLSEQVNDATVLLKSRRAQQTAAAIAAARAADALQDAKKAADKWTLDTYINLSGRPPQLPTPPTLPGRDNTTPLVDTPVDLLQKAQLALVQAQKASTAADAAAETQAKIVGDLQREVGARGAVLQQLKAERPAEVAQAEQQRDIVNSTLAAKYLRDANGQAGTAAQRAVAYALAQLGKPYVWGAEGPDTFDCSGLVQAAYAYGGVRLPRTARPQYRATRPVSVDALLPGDLLFFATDKSDWNTIHHVAIYLGNGKMVHAPTTGDVVRVAPVWWEEFFAATRVVPGQPGSAQPIQIPLGPSASEVSPTQPRTPTTPAKPGRPTTKPTTPGTPTTKPSAPGTPSTPPSTPTTPPSTPPPSTPGTPTTPPSTPGTPSASPSPSDSGSPSNSPSGSSTPSTPPSTSASPSPSPSASSSRSAATSPSASASATKSAAASVAPTTAAPATSAPATSAPKAAAPTAVAPTTVPTAAKPTAAKPTAAKPTAAKPTAAKPTAAKPTAAKPTAAKPVAPATEAPAALPPCTPPDPTKPATAADPTKTKALRGAAAPVAGKAATPLPAGMPVSVPSTTPLVGPAANPLVKPEAKTCQ